MKECKKCHEEKEESCFGKDIRKKDGLNIWCKSCLKTYREKYKDVVNYAAREYMREHAGEYYFLIRRRYAAIAQRCVNSEYSKSDKASKNPQTISYLKKNITLEFSLVEFRNWMLENKELFDSLEQPTISRKDQMGNYTLENLEIIEKTETYKKREVNRG